MPKHSNTIYQRTKTFLEKSKKVHSNKYDYSSVKYVNARTKIKIICPDHGKFDQLPQSHASGNGCKKCQDENNTLTTEEFISRSEVVHNNTYDYSQANYVNAHTKVCIICPIHGKFYQKADDHMKGYGCSKSPCRTNNYTIKEFITAASKKHNNRYDYSRVEYTNTKTKVAIVCPEHGEFLQKPNDHLNGAGCPKHGGMISHGNTALFVKLAKEKHGDTYDYTKTKYVDSKTKVTIVCPKHGEFLQSSCGHIRQAHGCPVCVKKSYSKIAIDWLELISKQNNIFIQHAGNIGEYRIPQTRYHADGYCEEISTIYEFYGDHFHGNLNIFKPHKHCHPFDRTITAGELYESTMNREEKIKELGYDLVTIWESDFRTQI